MRKPKEPVTVDPEQLEALRAALSGLDPGEKKAWLLEVYDRRDGEDQLAAVIDIKTGLPPRRRAIKTMER